MRKVKIITDSCADLSAEQLEKYDIDYARMSTIEDGKESPALLTWTPAEAHRLYETIRGGKRITTAQVSVEEFKSCSGALSVRGCLYRPFCCSWTCLSDLVRLQRRQRISRQSFNDLGNRLAGRSDRDRNDGCTAAYHKIYVACYCCCDALQPIASAAVQSTCIRNFDRRCNRYFCGAAA